MFLAGQMPVPRGTIFAIMIWWIGGGVNIDKEDKMAAKDREATYKLWKKAVTRTFEWVE